MRVLITGGAGFLGSHLCDRFLRDGHQVIAMDNLCTGSLQNIAHLQNNQDFTFVEQDICQPIVLAQSVDAVLNFASPASPSKTSPTSYLQLPLETMRVGSIGTQNALEVARQYNARFLMASTSEIYGDPLEHPQKETYWGHVDPIGVRSVYDEAKRFSEALTMAYWRKYGVQTRIVRIFNTYGPRMDLNDGRVVPNFIAQAVRGEALTVYGDGLQTRSFCYVSDLVEGIYRLLFSAESTPVNIGNPNEISILQFAQVINDVMENRAGIVFEPAQRVQGDPQQRRPDISKAQALLNWQPQVDLRAGLAETIAYFRQLLLAQ
jgi:dTDP-glucose 4,6-dehydratase